MKVYQIVAASMLAGAALGAVSVGGLNAQVKSPGAYAVVAFNEISDPAGFKTNVSDKACDCLGCYRLDIIQIKAQIDCEYADRIIGE